MSKDFKAENFFAFRSPSLPFGFISGWSEGLLSPTAAPQDLEKAFDADRERVRAKLKEAIQRPDIREAIFVASPDMEETIEPWLSGALQGEKAERVERSLIRYIVRMASRATPFGLFSGCSTGTWANDSHLEVESATQGLRHTRLDMDYLCELVEALEKDPKVRNTLKYTPNSSIYPAAGRLRYAEVRFSGERGRDYHLVALDPTPYLESTLQRAEAGATIDELAKPLTCPEITLEEARGFIHELIDNQVIVSNLYPAVTGEEPIHGVVAQLKGHPDTRELGERLGSVISRIEAIDEGACQGNPEIYRNLAKDLEALPAKIKIKHLYQVDLVKPAPKARLSHKVRARIEEGVDLLRRMADPKHRNTMGSFIESFTDRYENRWVPLLEVLDDESGIGFDKSSAPGSEASPLLEGLVFVGQGSEGGASFTRRDLHLLKKLMAEPDTMEFELTDEDMKVLEYKEPLAKVPGSFSAMPVLSGISPEALDAGDFDVLLEHYGGPSGARLLGRFCHGDEQLEACVKDHLASEEALEPDVIFAEIVHLPEGRMGNILCRPLLRGYEIPYLGVSGSSPEMQIPLQDLMVSVQGDRVVLRSEKLGKEIRPRLTSAHNYARGLGVYRFLCKMQDQDAISSGWGWGALDALPFLPRVRRGRFILNKARWMVEEKELKEIQKAKGAQVYRLFQEWRQKRNIPRHVQLADGDNTLFVDLENPLWLETLLSLVAKRSSFELQETFFQEDKLLVEGPEGKFCHELVVPFLRVEEKKEAKSAEPKVEEAPEEKFTPRTDIEPVQRSFPPGSEWLYLKIFAGTSTVDQILINHVAPLLEECDELYDQWFFIRYSEHGHHHLRLRFLGDPETLTRELQPLLHARLAPLFEDGLCWKTQLDTYDREIERYGGPVGMEFAEELFWHDSEAILSLVQEYPGDAGAEPRWRMGLVAVDELLNVLGFDLKQKARIIKNARESFGREFNSKLGLDVSLGDKFRKLRKELDLLLFEREYGELLEPGMKIIESRSQALEDWSNRIRQAEKDGMLQESVRSMVTSYTHMHLNRLLRAAQRAQEFVIYDFLDRLYDSRLAREKKK